MSFIYVPPAAPTSSPSYVFISTVTANNSATVDLEGMDSTYQNYVIYGSNITCVTGGNPPLVCRTKINGTYQTSGYAYQLFYNDNSAPQNNTNTTWINENGYSGALLYLNRLTNSICNFQMTIPNASSTSKYKPITSVAQGVLSSTTLWQSQTFGMCASGTQALTGMRFFIDGGNLATGTFTLYGIKNS